MNLTIESLNEYSTNSNLALNSTKTKWMMLSTRQMSTVHSLEEHSANIICREEPLERLSSTRLLGAQVGSKFIMAGTHNESSILMLCDLVCAEKAKKFAPFHIRKRLVESLVLSKLDYCNVVFSDMPDYQLKRLQRVQTMCAGYVLSRYATVADLKELRWLPIKECLEYSIAKLAHKSIYSEDSPIKLKQHVVQSYSLRSLNAPKLELASKLEIGIFQDQAAQVFNKLPAELRNCSNYSILICNY